MNYPTVTFLFFLLATGCVYFAVPKKLQWLVLLSVSVSFYILTCGSKVVFLLAATAIIYIGAMYIQKCESRFSRQKEGLEKKDRKALRKAIDRNKKIIVSVSVISTLMILLGTKYFNFFGSIINDIAGITGIKQPIPVLEILLPLGISYYTLMAISYLTDVYRGTVAAEKNPLMLLLFLCYFPHIIEGPFDRYRELSQQFRTPHSFEYNRIKNGGIRLVWGFFKKFVIADRAGLIVNTIFADTSSCSGSILFVAILLYTLQIYAEFSGCMDIVCGTSQMFGINIAENFRRPFFAGSINEFWRRWHITLGTWLKDYVFYPISLSGHFKKLNEKARKHIQSKYLLTLLPSAYALFFVWFCNGLWHGASGKYIFYGLYYYALMMLGQMIKPAADKILSRFEIKRGQGLYHIFEVLRTWIVVCFGMLIFRSETLSQAANIFIRILSDFRISGISDGTLLSGGISGHDYIILALSFLILFTVSFAEEKGINMEESISHQILPLRWTVYLFLLFAIIIFGAYGGNFNNATLIYGEF